MEEDLVPEPERLLTFVRKLKEVFDVCDEDSDGFIRPQHFVELGSQYGHAEQVKKLAKYLDPDSHGRINFKDFCRGVLTVKGYVGSLKKKSGARFSTGPHKTAKRCYWVCNTILGHTRERFSFTDHLVCVTLLQGDRFVEHHRSFPEDALRSTLQAYPMLNGSKLKTELSLIYSKEEFRACFGAVDLFHLFMENNTLLRIIITTPMTTAEAERCFSTLKRVKTFLRNTMTQERLNALAMLSMEKRLVCEMTDFDQRVIVKFAGQKERRATFMFK